MDDRIVACAGDPRFVPTYRSEGASGADLSARLEKDLIMKPGERALVPTGIRLEIPAGLEGQVRPRSGLAARQGLTVLNAPGTIDSDYRGEVQVILVNLGTADVVVHPGDRIAQIVLCPVLRAAFRLSEKVQETQRGDGGFGSTGV